METAQQSTGSDCPARLIKRGSATRAHTGVLKGTIDTRRLDLLAGGATLSIFTVTTLLTNTSSLPQQRQLRDAHAG
jgi:hypothetical protein